MRFPTDLSWRINGMELLALLCFIVKQLVADEALLCHTIF